MKRKRSKRLYKYVRRNHKKTCLAGKTKAPFKQEAWSYQVSKIWRKVPTLWFWNKWLCCIKNVVKRNWTWLPVGKKHPAAFIANRLTCYGNLDDQNIYWHEHTVGSKCLRPHLKTWKSTFVIKRRQIIVIFLVPLAHINLLGKFWSYAGITAIIRFWTNMWSPGQLNCMLS